MNKIVTPARALVAEHRALVKLRVSVARVAQVAGVSLAVVSLPDDADVTAIRKCAIWRDTGWNTLAARIAHAFDDIAMDANSVGTNAERPFSGPPKCAPPFKGVRR